MTRHYASPEARERDRKRKIYMRQAERFIKQSQISSSGVESERYRSAARGAIENAMGTYDSKSKVKGKIAKLAEELGVETKPSDVTQYQRSLILSRADRMKASNETENAKARSILAGQAGRRFWAATGDIWENAPGEIGREQSVIEWFAKRFDGIENLMDVLAIMEEEFPNIYDAEETANDFYRDATRVIGNFVAANE